MIDFIEEMAEEEMESFTVINEKPKVIEIGDEKRSFW